MTKLIALFVAMCRLQANPQDVPSSYVLKYLTILAYMGIGLVVTLLNQELAKALITVIVDTALMLGLAYAGLWVRGYNDRTTQTITALAGTGVCFSLLGLPILASLQGVDSSQPNFASILLLILNVWYVVVIGHILRHALSLPFWAGIGISIFYVYTSIRVMSALFIAGS